MNLFSANLYDNPLNLFLASQNDLQNLQPLYELAHSRIRLVDNETIIFFEPTVNGGTWVGFTAGPGGPEYNDRQVFGYHVYCGNVDSLGDPKSVPNCHYVDEMLFGVRLTFAQNLSLAAFVTEFGAVSNSTSGASEIQFITDTADANLQSWAYWQFKYYNDPTTQSNPPTSESLYGPDGSLQTLKLKMLARSYVYATCGTPLKQSFDVNNGDFNFVWAASDECQGFNTELYLSVDFYYPSGYTYQFEGCTGCLLEPLNGSPYYFEVLLPISFVEGTHLSLLVQAKSSEEVIHI